MDNKNRQAEEKREEQNRPERAVSILLIVILLCVFGVIVLFTGILGNLFGKAVENIVLIVIAAVLAFCCCERNRYREGGFDRL